MQIENLQGALRPTFIEVDHVSWTVLDLDATVRFYVNVFGATELYRIGPVDAADLPVDSSGRDWTEAHLNVAGARLQLVMMRLTANMKFQLVQYEKPIERSQLIPRTCDLGGHHLAIKVDDVEKAIRYLKAHGCTVLDVIAMDEGPLAGKKNVYIFDPWGHQLELVD